MTKICYSYTIIILYKLPWFLQEWRLTVWDSEITGHTR